MKKRNRFIFVLATFVFTIHFAGCADHQIDAERDFAIKAGEITWIKTFKGAVFIGLNPVNVTEDKKILAEFGLQSDKSILLFEKVDQEQMDIVLADLTNKYDQLPEKIRTEIGDSVCQVVRITGATGTEVDYIYMNFFPREIELSDPPKVYRKIIGFSGGRDRFFRILYNLKTKKISIKANDHK